MSVRNIVDKDNNNQLLALVSYHGYNGNINVNKYSSKVYLILFSLILIYDYNLSN